MVLTLEVKYFFGAYLTRIYGKASALWSINLSTIIFQCLHHHYYLILTKQQNNWYLLVMPVKPLDLNQRNLFRGIFLNYLSDWNDWNRTHKMRNVWQVFLYCIIILLWACKWNKLCTRTFASLLLCQRECFRDKFHCVGDVGSQNTKFGPVRIRN